MRFLVIRLPLQNLFLPIHLFGKRYLKLLYTGFLIRSFNYHNFYGLEILFIAFSGCRLLVDFLVKTSLFTANEHPVTASEDIEQKKAPCLHSLGISHYSSISLGKRQNFMKLEKWFLTDKLGELDWYIKSGKIVL